MLSLMEQAYISLTSGIVRDENYSEPFFKICQEYRWHYLIRFKAANTPTVGQEFEALKAMGGLEKINADNNGIVTQHRDINLGVFVNLKRGQKKQKTC